MRYSIATISGAALLSVVALEFLPVPFLWIGLVWGVAALVVAAAAPRTLKLPIVLAACVPFAFALGELMFPPVVDRTLSPLPFREDALLGWRLKPSQVSRALAKADGELIYDVTYSTDPAGLRVAPPDRGDQVEGCLLFFSDSFAFGEGVADDQTFPYQVGRQTDGRFRIVNLAVPGYGAEHMLAAIERGALATDPPCEPTHLFYVALPHHIHRAARKTTFSGAAPRYRLGPNGIPEYLGTNLGRSAGAVDGSSWREWLRPLTHRLCRSRICRALRDRPLPTTEDDIALYFAIVRQAFRLFERRWPEAEIHVISWDIHSFLSNGQARFHDGLESIHAHVHFIDEILPGYTQDPTQYGIDQLDLHPNASSHRLVASYLSERVLAPTTSANSEDVVDERGEQATSRNHSHIGAATVFGERTAGE